MTEFLKNTFGEAVTDDVIKSFNSELGKKFVAKTDYNTKRDELKNTLEELESFKQQLEAEKLKSAEADNLSDKLSALQTKYDEHVSVLNSKLEQVHLENEIGMIIRKSGGKNEKALRALLDLNGENPVEAAKDQLEVIKTSDPYLFDTPAPGGTKGNFPRSTVSEAPLTYSQMMKLEQNNGNY